MLPRAGKSFGKVEDGSVFRIDDVNLFTGNLATAGFERGEGMVIEVVVAVVIFLGGGQDKPVAGGHLPDGFAGTVYAKAAVGGEVYLYVVGASGGIGPGEGNFQRIDGFAERGGPVAAVAANGDSGQFVVGFGEPFR